MRLDKSGGLLKSGCCKRLAELKKKRSRTILLYFLCQKAQKITSWKPGGLLNTVCAEQVHKKFPDTTTQISPPTVVYRNPPAESSFAFIPSFALDFHKSVKQEVMLHRIIITSVLCRFLLPCAQKDRQNQRAEGESSRNEGGMVWWMWLLPRNEPVERGSAGSPSGRRRQGRKCRGEASRRCASPCESATPPSG